MSISSTDNISNCSICLDEAPLETLYKTICGHNFHYNCLLKWFEKKKILSIL